MHGVYCTFEELKEYLAGTEKANFHPKDDSRLKRFCVEMSRKFDTEANRAFVPRLQTRYYDHPGTSATVSPYPPYSYPIAYPSSPILRPAQRLQYADTLLLDDDLLEVVELTTNNGDTTISASDYWLMTGNSYNFPPYDTVKLKPNGTTTLFGWVDTLQHANAVEGYWGYHDEYSLAWQAVDELQVSVNSTEGSIEVDDVDGDDEMGLPVRFKTQQLIRLEDEFCYITGKSPEGNTLDIKRAVNGTTAASDTAGTSIYVYRPMEELKHAMEVLATWAYRRKDSVGAPGEDNPMATMSGVLIMPSTLPGEVKSMLAKYKREPTR